MRDTPASHMDELRRALIGLLPKLRRFALTLTGDAGQADDLVLQTCARAIAKSPVGDSNLRLDGWVYTLARMLWVEETRKQTSFACEASSDPASHAMVAPSASSLAIVLSLPQGLASVFLLADVESRTYEETAGILGQPVETVMARLCAARLKMAMIVAEEEARRA